MPLAALPAIAVLSITLCGLGGCSGGAALGEVCDRHSDCDDALQCVNRVCTARCLRAPDCGDGYACDEQGLCVLADGKSGELCTSEVDCAPGLSCRIEVAADARMIRSCTSQANGAPAGAPCVADEDCRNGTCALGRCVDLCRDQSDCATGMSCMKIPNVEANGETFGGCLASSGTVSWTIPSPPPGKTRILLPVPSRATQASLVLSTAAPRTVGVTRVLSPSSGRALYQRCPRGADNCKEADQRAQFYANALRHRHEVGMSVLAIPSTSGAELERGRAYPIDVGSFHIDGTPGPTPALTAVVRLDPVVRLAAPSILDLHFHFLDLADHPCAAAFGTATLDKDSAQADAPFRHEFLGRLTSILEDDAALTVGNITYEDIDRPDLDGLEVANAGELFALAKHAQGINVFFVRTLSPVGIQGYAPSPGPAGLAGTPKSGIVIGIDTLCFRSWEQLARLTAHEIARYMGLYQNVEISGTEFDGIDDSDGSIGNLMFYSELGGTALSPGQRDILRRSPVLR